MKICTSGTDVSYDATYVESRWKGVAKIVEDTSKDVLAIVRLAVGKKDAGTAAYEPTLRAAFKEADITFEMSGNEFELAVLAAAVLAQLFTQKAVKSDIAALALISYAGVTTLPPWFQPFSKIANDYLQSRLISIRQPVSITQPAFNIKTAKGLSDAFITKFQDNNLPATADAATKAFDAIYAAIAATTRTTALALAELERQSSLRREETDTLWWINTGISRDLQVPFTTLKRPAAAIIAGKELGDLVRCPGVYPAEALLSYLLPATGQKSSDKPASIATAVNALSREWREVTAGLPGLDKVADLCPVLSAIRMSLTTDSAKDWQSAYTKSYGIETGTALDPVALSMQCYRERVLVKGVQ